MIKARLYFGLFLLFLLIIFSSWLASRQPVKKINPTIFSFIPVDSQVLLSADLDQIDFNQYVLRPEVLKSWFNFLTPELWQEIISMSAQELAIAAGENFNLVVVKSGGFFEINGDKDPGSAWSPVGGSYWLWSNSKDTLAKTKDLLRYPSSSLASQKDFLKITRSLPATTSAWFYFNNQTLAQPVVAVADDLKSDNLKVELVSLNQNQSEKKLKILLPGFEGSGLIGADFAEDRKILGYLLPLKSNQPMPGESFNLSDLISNFGSEYQIYFNDKDWLVVFKVADSGRIIEPTKALEVAWQSYVAKDFPLEREEILPDGSKAVYYFKNTGAVKFQSESFLEQAIYFLSTKDGQASLALAMVDDYWLASSKLDLIKQLLQAQQQPTDLKWWDFLKTKLTPKLNLERSWRWRLSDIQKYATVPLVLSSYKNLELAGYSEDGLSRIRLKLIK